MLGRRRVRNPRWEPARAGDGDDPRSPANRGSGSGMIPDPRQIGDGTPTPDPRQIGVGDGDRDRGLRALAHIISAGLIRAKLHAPPSPESQLELTRSGIGLTGPGNPERLQGASTNHALKFLLISHMNLKPCGPGHRDCPGRACGLVSSYTTVTASFRRRQDPPRATGTSGWTPTLGPLRARGPGPGPAAPQSRCQCEAERPLTFEVASPATGSLNSKATRGLGPEPP